MPIDISSFRERAIMSRCIEDLKRLWPSLNGHSAAYQDSMIQEVLERHLSELVDNPDVMELEEEIERLEDVEQKYEDAIGKIIQSANDILRDAEVEVGKKE